MPPKLQEKKLEISGKKKQKEIKFLRSCLDSKQRKMNYFFQAKRQKSQGLKSIKIEENNLKPEMTQKPKTNLRSSYSLQNQFD